MIPLISLEDTYEALSVFEILAIEKRPDVSTTTCQKVLETLGSSSPPKDVFYALKVNGKLKCGANENTLKVTSGTVHSYKTSFVAFLILKLDTGICFFL